MASVPGFVLVVNAGSSSLKYRLVDPDSGEVRGRGLVEQIGEPTGRHSHVTSEGDRHIEQGAFSTFEQALQAAVESFEQHPPSLREVDLVAVGHRVVHGGDRFDEPTLIDDDVVAAISELTPLAPLHNPANLEGIEVAPHLLPTHSSIARVGRICSQWGTGPVDSGVRWERPS
jgi:acetate kinase